MRIGGGQTYTVKVERRGGSIKAYLNDTPAATATDATLTSGQVGFGSRNDAATFDNLKVTR